MMALSACLQKTPANSGASAAKVPSGSIICTASVAGLTSYPWLGPYNTSKHGAVTICETLHAELREATRWRHDDARAPGLVSLHDFLRRSVLADDLARDAS